MNTLLRNGGIGILAVLVLAACGPQAEPPVRSIEKKKAPEFKLPRLAGGEPFDSSAFKGKIVVLNFFTSWSPGSAAELPRLQAIQDEFSKDGIMVVAVSLDELDGRDAMVLVENSGISLPVLLGKPGIREKFGGIEAIPSTFVLDPQGNMVNRFTGPVDLNQLLAEIGLLKKEQEELRK
jgi:peroxiredoxin